MEEMPLWKKEIFHLVRQMTEAEVQRAAEAIRSG